MSLVISIIVNEHRSPPSLSPPTSTDAPASLSSLLPFAVPESIPSHGDGSSLPSTVALDSLAALTGPAVYSAFAVMTALAPVSPPASISSTPSDHARAATEPLAVKASLAPLTSLHADLPSPPLPPLPAIAPARTPHERRFSRTSWTHLLSTPLVTSRAVSSAAFPSPPPRLSLPSRSSHLSRIGGFNRCPQCLRCYPF